MKEGIEILIEKVVKTSVSENGKLCFLNSKITGDVSVCTDNINCINVGDEALILYRPHSENNHEFINTRINNMTVCDFILNIPFMSKIDILNFTSGYRILINSYSGAINNNRSIIMQEGMYIKELKTLIYSFEDNYVRYMTLPVLNYLYKVYKDDANDIKINNAYRLVTKDIKNKYDKIPLVNIIKKIDDKIEINENIFSIHAYIKNRKINSRTAYDKICMSLNLNDVYNGITIYSGDHTNIRITKVGVRELKIEHVGVFDTEIIKYDTNEMYKFIDNLVIIRRTEIIYKKENT